jgi:hypothetical protein
MKFDVTLFFKGETTTPAVAANLRRFLREAPHLLKPHSQRDIRYEVSDVTVHHLELIMHLDVCPSWPARGHISDSDLRRIGVSHPARARASTALLLWICSMFESERNPLLCAWREFTGDQAATLPITLYTYDFRVTPPSNAVGRCLASSVSPPTRKFDTGQPQPGQVQYDGTEKTRA